MKIELIKCAQCGHEFKSYKSSNRKYCSHKCANSVSMQIRQDNAAHIVFVCEVCGKEFSRLACKAKYRTNRFCSAICYHASIKVSEKKCPSCGVDFTPASKLQRFCCNKCRYNAQIGTKKTGFWYENGYKVLYSEKGNGIKEHIKIMEEHLCRKLKKDEIVHHKNRVKDDNRLENLEIMARGEHSQLHREDEKLNDKTLFGGMGGHHGKTKYK